MEIDIDKIIGKEIDYDTIEIDGIDMSDYPDFCDAYISYAEYIDGEPLTDIELAKLTEDEGDLINSRIHENQLYLNYLD
jgi:hypothetical protein